MKSIAMTLSASTILLFNTVGVVRSQVQQPGTTVGGQMLRLDMPKQEALRQFSACCNTIPLGENAIIIQNNKSTAHELGGIVYFQHGKISGVAADRSWSSEAAPYETALALYRLVDKLAHGIPTTVTVYPYGKETSNGTGRYVVLQFPDGHRIRLEMTQLDPGANITQQVVVSECVGACSDW